MTEKAPPTHTEAPASFNVRYNFLGYDCQLTLRANSGAELLPVIISAIDWLKEHGAEPTGKVTPAAFAPAADQPKQEAPKMPDGTPDPSWCAIHGVAMARREKDGQVWFSHKVGDNYCRGK